MSMNHVHTVTVAEGFVLTGTINASAPDDMSVNVDGVKANAFTDQQYRQHFETGVEALNAHFDTVFLVQGQDSPIEGMTVAVNGDDVSVTLVGEGDGMLISQAKMADAVIGASVQRILAA